MKGDESRQTSPLWLGVQVVIGRLSFAGGCIYTQSSIQAAGEEGQVGPCS